MTLSQWFVGTTLKTITDLMFRVDGSELAKIPSHGPLILITNHVHMPEIPTLFLRLVPRPVTGMLLASRWDNALLRWMLNTFHIIPLRRGEADLAGLRLGLKMLNKGYIVIVDPEGTRSHDGRLQAGRAGAVLMALRSGAPLIPVVHYGSENYMQNLRRLRRTDFTSSLANHSTSTRSWPPRCTTCASRSLTRSWPRWQPCCRHSTAAPTPT